MLSSFPELILADEWYKWQIQQTQDVNESIMDKSLSDIAPSMNNEEKERILKQSRMRRIGVRAMLQATLEGTLDPDYNIPDMFTKRSIKSIREASHVLNNYFDQVDSNFDEYFTREGNTDPRGYIFGGFNIEHNVLQNLQRFDGQYIQTINGIAEEMKNAAGSLREGLDFKNRFIDDDSVTKAFIEQAKDVDTGFFQNAKMNSLKHQLYTAFESIASNLNHYNVLAPPMQNFISQHADEITEIDNQQQKMGLISVKLMRRILKNVEGMETLHQFAHSQERLAKRLGPILETAQKFKQEQQDKGKSLPEVINSLTSSEAHNLVQFVHLFGADDKEPIMNTLSTNANTLNSLIMTAGGNMQFLGQPIKDIFGEGAAQVSAYNDVTTKIQNTILDMKDQFDREIQDFHQIYISSFVQGQQLVKNSQMIPTRWLTRGGVPDDFQTQAVHSTVKSLKSFIDLYGVDQKEYALKSDHDRFEMITSEELHGLSRLTNRAQMHGLNQYPMMENILRDYGEIGNFYQQNYSSGDKPGQFVMFLEHLAKGNTDQFKPQKGKVIANRIYQHLLNDELNWMLIGSKVNYAPKSVASLLAQIYRPTNLPHLSDPIKDDPTRQFDIGAFIGWWTGEEQFINRALETRLDRHDKKTVRSVLKRLYYAKCNDLVYRLLSNRMVDQVSSHHILREQTHQNLAASMIENQSFQQEQAHDQELENFVASDQNIDPEFLQLLEALNIRKQVRIDRDRQSQQEGIHAAHVNDGVRIRGANLRDELNVSGIDNISQQNLDQVDPVMDTRHGVIDQSFQDVDSVDMKRMASMRLVTVDVINDQLQQNRRYDSIAQVQGIQSIQNQQTIDETAGDKFMNEFKDQMQFLEHTGGGNLHDDLVEQLMIQPGEDYFNVPPKFAPIVDGVVSTIQRENDDEEFPDFDTHEIRSSRTVTQKSSKSQGSSSIRTGDSQKHQQQHAEDDDSLPDFDTHEIDGSRTRTRKPSKSQHSSSIHTADVQDEINQQRVDEDSSHGLVEEFKGQPLRPQDEDVDQNLHTREIPSDTEMAIGARYGRQFTQSVLSQDSNLAANLRQQMRDAATVENTQMNVPAFLQGREVAQVRTVLNQQDSIQTPFVQQQIQIQSGLTGLPGMRKTDSMMMDAKNPMSVFTNADLKKSKITDVKVKQVDMQEEQTRDEGASNVSSSKQGNQDPPPKFDKPVDTKLFAPGPPSSNPSSSSHASTFRNNSGTEQDNQEEEEEEEEQEEEEQHDQLSTQSTMFVYPASRPPIPSQWIDGLRAQPTSSTFPSIPKPMYQHNLSIKNISNISQNMSLMFDDDGMDITQNFAPGAKQTQARGGGGALPNSQWIQQYIIHIPTVIESIQQKLNELVNPNIPMQPTPMLEQDMEVQLMNEFYKNLHDSTHFNSFLHFMQTLPYGKEFDLVLQRMEDLSKTYEQVVMRRQRDTMNTFLTDGQMGALRNQATQQINFMNALAAKSSALRSIMDVSPSMIVLPFILNTYGDLVDKLQTDSYNSTSLFDTTMSRLENQLQGTNYDLNQQIAGVSRQLRLKIINEQEGTIQKFLDSTINQIFEFMEKSEDSLLQRQLTDQQQSHVRAVVDQTRTKSDEIFRHLQSNLRYVVNTSVQNALTKQLSEQDNVYERIQKVSTLQNFVRLVSNQILQDQLGTTGKTPNTFSNQDEKFEITHRTNYLMNQIIDQVIQDQPLQLIRQMAVYMMRDSQLVDACQILSDPDHANTESKKDFIEKYMIAMGSSPTKASTIANRKDKFHIVDSLIHNLRLQTINQNTGRVQLTNNVINQLSRVFAVIHSQAYKGKSDNPQMSDIDEITQLLRQGDSGDGGDIIRGGIEDIQTYEMVFKTLTGLTLEDLEIITTSGKKHESNQLLRDVLQSHALLKSTWQNPGFGGISRKRFVQTQDDPALPEQLKAAHHVHELVNEKSIQLNIQELPASQQGRLQDEVEQVRQRQQIQKNNPNVTTEHEPRLIPLEQRKQFNQIVTGSNALFRNSGSQLRQQMFQTGFSGGGAGGISQQIGSIKEQLHRRSVQRERVAGEIDRFRRQSDERSIEQDHLNITVRRAADLQNVNQVREAVRSNTPNELNVTKQEINADVAMSTIIDPTRTMLQQDSRVIESIFSQNEINAFKTYYERLGNESSSQKISENGIRIKDIVWGFLKHLGNQGNNPSSSWNTDNNVQGFIKGEITLNDKELENGTLMLINLSSSLNEEISKTMQLELPLNDGLLIDANLLFHMTDTLMSGGYIVPPPLLKGLRDLVDETRQACVNYQVEQMVSLHDYLERDMHELHSVIGSYETIAGLEEGRTAAERQLQHEKSEVATLRQKLESTQRSVQQAAEEEKYIKNLDNKLTEIIHSAGITDRLNAAALREQIKPYIENKMTGGVDRPSRLFQTSRGISSALGAMDQEAINQEERRRNQINLNSDEARRQQQEIVNEMRRQQMQQAPPQFQQAQASIPQQFGNSGQYFQSIQNRRLHQDMLNKKENMLRYYNKRNRKRRRSGGRPFYLNQTSSIRDRVTRPQSERRVNTKGAQNEILTRGFALKFFDRVSQVSTKKKKLKRRRASSRRAK